MVKLDLNLDPDPSSEKLMDPDPHKMNADPQPYLKVDRYGSRTALYCMVQLESSGRMSHWSTMQPTSCTREGAGGPHLAELQGRIQGVAIAPPPPLAGVGSTALAPCE